jgi:nucleoid-associated protein YgaU
MKLKKSRIKKILKLIKARQNLIKNLSIFFFVFSAVSLTVYFLPNPNSTQSQKIETKYPEISQTVHVVKEGDSLWKISEKYLGNGFLWEKISEANQIKDPKNIRIGDRIIIPTPSYVKHPLPTPSDINNPANTSSIKTEAKSYTVQKDDDLWSIAEKTYGSGYNWVDIASANNLKNPNLITEGQTLFLPNVYPKKPTTSLKQKPTNLTPINSGEYTIAKGDNLWTIAVRAYSDGYRWVEIAKANGLTNPNLIFPNVKILIPRNTYDIIKK